MHDDKTENENCETRPGMKRRVRECHTCPLNGKGDDYCWKVCLGPSSNSEKGQSIRRLGQFDAPDEFLDANAADDPNDPNPRDDDPASGIDMSNATESDDEENRAYENDTQQDNYPQAEEDRDDEDEEEEDGGDQDDRRITEELSDSVERALVPVLANLMALSDTQLCIFRHVFHGDDLKATGAGLPVPISKQAVFKHLLGMCRTNKVVAKVIHGMMKQGHGGASRTHSQLDLFDFAGLEM